jgi:hypothetical protein
MEGIYLESSLLDLKPKVLEFLTYLADKAKTAKDFALSFKNKEMAEETGKDVRTIARYLHTLQEHQIIQRQGVKGRTGGTVIMFNTDLIHFDTSDKALINTDEPVSFDKVVRERIPKSNKPKKESTKVRRTKTQMAEAKVLQNTVQAEIDRLNDLLHKTGGYPDWEWFKETNDPTGNYRTYLITRAYNRLAGLSVDYNNAIAQVKKEDKKLPQVTNNYDVLPVDFYGSSRWQEFDRFRKFCDENNIDPLSYLSAQFSRSVHTASVSKKPKKMLPFTNALTSDASYQVYQEFLAFKDGYDRGYTEFRIPPVSFGSDFVLIAIRDAIETSERQLGFIEYRQSFREFFYGEGHTIEEQSLANFYDMTVANMRRLKISKKSQTAIKKFLAVQSMILTGGTMQLPNYVILGSEVTQIVFHSLKAPMQSPQEYEKLVLKALRAFLYPKDKNTDHSDQLNMLFYEMNLMDDTSYTLRLIQQRQGIYVSLSDLRMAFEEYGKNKIPLDDYSVIQVNKIVAIISKTEELVDETADFVDMAKIAITDDWQILAEIGEDTLDYPDFKETLGG